MSTTKKSWGEFKQSGLLFLTNQILHVFGYAIVLEYDKETDSEPCNVYPARVTYRGFGEKTQDAGYENLATYMHSNSLKLLNEVFGVEEKK